MVKGPPNCVRVVTDFQKIKDLTSKDSTLKSLGRYDPSIHTLKLIYPGA